MAVPRRDTAPAHLELCPDNGRAQEGQCPWTPGAVAGQAVPYLREDVGALLQQRHGRVADAGGQLDPQQLLLERGVLLQGVGQGHGSAPVGQRVRGEEPSAEQLTRRDRVTCSYQSGQEGRGGLKQATELAKYLRQTNEVLGKAKPNRPASQSSH